MRALEEIGPNPIATCFECAQVILEEQTKHLRTEILNKDYRGQSFLFLLIITIYIYIYIYTYMKSDCKTFITKWNTQLRLRNNA